MKRGPVPNEFPRRESRLRVALIGEIDPIELDYITGWLACDAHFDKNGVTISLQLQKRDVSVLHLFNKVLCGWLDQSVRVWNRFEYVRARAYSRVAWSHFTELFQGRLKKHKQPPTVLTDAFIVGCLDADGSFFVKNDSVAGEFQHESPAMLEGVARYLESKGASVNRRDHNRIAFWQTACKVIKGIYEQVPCRLDRKYQRLCHSHTPPNWWWKPAEVEKLKQFYGLVPNTQLAINLGKSPKAVQLKAWKMGYARPRS